jgi:hypothetical protein
MLLQTNGDALLPANKEMEPYVCNCTRLNSENLNEGESGLIPRVIRKGTNPCCHLSLTFVKFVAENERAMPCPDFLPACRF